MGAAPQDSHGELPRVGQRPAGAPGADTVGGLSFNFTAAAGRDVMLLSGQTGLKSYDVSTPDQPVLLDHVTNQELALPGDNPSPDNYWENEDVEIDHKRTLVFMARERTALGVPPRPRTSRTTRTLPQPTTPAAGRDRPYVPARPLTPDPVWGMICPMAAGRPCEPGALSCC